ncbi:hypothetical protein [Parapedobacter indicus]|nr:hypothetical protein [Parapedobacter indicus]
MRIRFKYPGFLLLLAILLLVLAVWVYLHYQHNLDRIEQEMQKMEMH